MKIWAGVAALAVSVALAAPAGAAEGLICMHDFDRAGEDAIHAMLTAGSAPSAAQRRRLVDAGMAVLNARLRDCQEQYGWSDEAAAAAGSYRVWRLMRARMHMGLPYFTAERRAMEASWTDAELAPMIAFAQEQVDAAGPGPTTLDIPEARLRQILPNALVIAAMRRAGLGRHGAAANLVRLELYASLMAEAYSVRFEAAE